MKSSLPVLLQKVRLREKPEVSAYLTGLSDAAKHSAAEQLLRSSQPVALPPPPSCPWLQGVLQHIWLSYHTEIGFSFVPSRTVLLRVRTELRPGGRYIVRHAAGSFLGAVVLHHKLMAAASHETQLKDVMRMDQDDTRAPAFRLQVQRLLEERSQVPEDQGVVLAERIFLGGAVDDLGTRFREENPEPIAMFGKLLRRLIVNRGYVFSDADWINHLSGRS